MTSSILMTEGSVYRRALHRCTRRPMPWSGNCSSRSHKLSTQHWIIINQHYTIEDRALDEIFYQQNVETSSAYAVHTLWWIRFGLHDVECKRLVCTTWNANVWSARRGMQTFVLYDVEWKRLVCTTWNANVWSARRGMQTFVLYDVECKRLVCVFWSSDMIFSEEHRFFLLEKQPIQCVHIINNKNYSYKEKIWNTSYTSLFPQDMLRDIYMYNLHWNLIHKFIGVSWNVGPYKIIRLPRHHNLNLT